MISTEPIIDARTDSLVAARQPAPAAAPALETHVERNPILCEVCGAVAVVHVLDQYVKGQPHLRRFCGACRAATHFGLAGAEQPGPRLRLSTLLALVGLSAVFVGLLGDYLDFRAAPGFGVFQGGGLLLGLLAILVGAILRVDLVVLGGLMLVGVSLCTDFFGLTRGSGIGAKQQLLISLGLLALVVAAAARQARSLASSATRDRPPAQTFALGRSR